MKGVPKKVDRRRQCGSRLVVKVHITDHVLSFTESRNRAVQEDRHQAWWTRLCLRPSYSSSRRCTLLAMQRTQHGDSSTRLSIMRDWLLSKCTTTNFLSRSTSTHFSIFFSLCCLLPYKFPRRKVIVSDFNVVISFSGRSFAFLSSSSPPIFCSVQLCFTSVVTSFPQLLLPTLSSTLLGC